MSGALLPLYPHDVFGYFSGLLCGTLIGFCFGFVLERSGFGRAPILAAQFYLTDTRVLKVMFTAIVTALLGITLLSGAGLLDLSKVTVPETFLWPQLIGGLLLGMGFIVSGYCPGTGVVAMASGNLDGAVAIGGVMAGSLLFGFGWPVLEGFYASGARGVVTLPSLLGVPMALLAAAVAAMAAGAFAGAEKLEALFSKREGIEPPPSPRPARTRLFLGFAVASAAAIALLAVPSRPSAPAAPAVRAVSATGLARLLAASPSDYWVVDVRGEKAAAAGVVPGAVVLPSADAEAFFAGLAPTRRLVLYGEGELGAPPAGAGRFRGEVLVLAGGYAAFRDQVLTEPKPPTEATPALVADYRMRSALYGRFTGAASVAAPPKVQVKAVSTGAEAPKKGGGC